MRFLSLLFLLFSFLTAPAQNSQTALLLRVGRLYDAEKNAFLPDQEILVVGDRIAAVGKKLKRPRNVRVIDLPGGTATPGLIDAHTHLLLDQHFDQQAMAVASKIPARERLNKALAYADDYLRVGFTTARDVGNSGQFLDLDLKKELSQGKKPALTLYGSGPILSPPGGQFGRLYPADSFLIDQEFRVIRGVDDARAAVLDHIRRGVDVIKVCMNTDNRVLAPEEIKAIVATAHQNKIPVTAHATYDESARDAVRAGVDGIEHGYSLSDSTLSLMAQRGTYLVPTDPSWAQGRIRVAAVGMKGPEGEDYLKQALTGFHDRLQRAHKKGIWLVAGSDYYNNIPTLTRGAGAVDVLLSYHEADIPVATVLQMATRNAAKVLGISEQTGMLKPGLKADLVVFDGDFEKNFPQTLSNVKLVLKAGKEVRLKN